MKTKKFLSAILSLVMLLSVFSFTVSASNWEIESNDSITKANLISLNSTYYGTIKDGNDWDYYKFILPSDGYIVINFNHPQLDSGFWHIYLTDADGESIFKSDYWNFWSFPGIKISKTKTEKIGLPAGTYYVAIEGEGSINGVEYNLSVDFTSSSVYESEYNDTLTKADSILFNKVYYGSMSFSNDKDYYRITSDKNETAKITLSYENIEDAYFVEMLLLDLDGQVISKWSVAVYESSPFTTEKFSLAKGTYYIVIKNDSATGIAYNFKIETDHKFTETVVTAATTSSDGKLKCTCKDCGYVEYKTIPKVSTVKLSSTKFTYSGNANTPTLTVKDSNGKALKKNTDYKISGNASKTACGVYTMKITFMGKYSGTKSITWTVVPKAVKTTVKLYGYDDVQINWNKVTGAQGYRVYYKKSTDSSWKSKDVTTNSAKLSNLADGVKYQIRVRAFVKSSSGSVYTSKEDTNTPTIYTLKKISTPKVSKYASGKVKVSWTNINGESGYQISKSTSKTGTNVVSTYSTTDGSSKVLSVTKGKTYYYKVRAYKTVDGNKIYGPWSDVKSYKCS